MKLVNVIESNQKVKKIYFLCNDNTEIESCLLYLKKHGTVICISSQVGCSQRCQFCAAGLKDFIRNLSAAEIQEQVELIVKHFPESFINGFEITYMGSGEPFNNSEALNQTVEFFFSHYANLRKINISTLLPKLNNGFINSWSKYKGNLHLQFSLHFCDDQKRHKYFDYPLPTIESSLQYLDTLSKQLNDKYTINYVLFDKINDTAEDAIKLAALTKERNAYIKISEMSPISKSNMQKSSNLLLFQSILKKYTVEYEYFESMGKDVNAGCGQFYNEALI